MNPQETALRFSGVRKTFGQVTALDSFDLELKQGELVTLLGPSGCGKTTALRIAAGFEQPNSGSVFVKDKDVTALPAHTRNMGMVFQNFNLFPHMSVIDNITLSPIRTIGVDKALAKAKAHDLLERFGLADKAKSYPDQLSGGQQQRVAIVRALAIEPEVLLLDEITSSLDPELVGEVLDVVRELKASGMTLVLATHEMGFARDTSDVVCVLDEGLIIEQGPPAQVFSRPTSERAQQFLERVIRSGRL